MPDQTASIRPCRDAEDAAYDKKGKAAPLHDVVVQDKRRNEKRDREHKPGGRDVVQDEMGVRPGLRRGDVGNGDGRLQLAVIDLEAKFVRDNCQGQTDSRETKHQMERITGRATSAPRSPQL